MAPSAILSAFMYVDGYDATGDGNALSLSASGVDLDATNFRSQGWEEVKRGAKSFDFGYDGWWSADATRQIDDESFGQLGSSKVFTAGMAETEATPALMFQAMKHNYTAFGKYGDLAPFSLQSKGSDGVGVVRGQLAKAKGNVSATGALGTGLNLGAVSATQYLYATFHVFSAGTTITAVLESDDASNFPSATTRATIGPLTTYGGTWATRVAGSITDSYFRFRVTAVTGTFSVAGAIAVQ